MISRVDENGFLWHWCEGCGTKHIVPAAAPHPNPWTFNGDTETPTLSPSVKLTWGKDFSQVCHYFISAGSIVYCDDCTHELRGQNRPLVDIPADWQ